MGFKRNIVNSMGKNGQFNRQREEIMKNVAVLTSFVFLFGVGSAAVADTVNYNDIVQAGGAAANDGGEAVAGSNNMNENQVGSNNRDTRHTEFTPKGEVVNTSTSSNASKTNADNYNKQEVETEGKGNAATMTGDAFADSRDQSSHTYVEAAAEEGSLAAINTAAGMTL